MFGGHKTSHRHMAKRNRKKSSTKKWLIIGVIGVAALYYLYNQTLKISVGGASVRVHKINVGNVELRIDMTIINESNLELDVQGFLGQVFYAQTSLGIVTQVRPVTLAAFQTGVVEFKAEISYASVGLEFWDELKALITKTKAASTLINPAAFRVIGTLRAEGLSIPINETLLV
jgi:hypothetical protein